MVASGNDWIPSCQAFTLADKQNIAFDREWAFFFTLMIQKYYMYIATLWISFLQRWSGYFGGEKKYAFPEWQGESYNYWVILGLDAFKTNLWQILDIWFLTTIH